MTRDDVALFSKVSGDLNPIHMDEEYARAQGAQGVVGHSLCCARQSLEGEEESERISESETPCCGPPGASPEPVRIGHPPEPSVAWCGSDPACEANTGGVQAV
nr:MaoC/PaaZ C-terminal domain-containing protein [Halochromatium glycolicum]